MTVIATAGHVDHGKTSLVGALTGVNTDRLAEEQRRGLTIDLGFAHAALPSGREVSFIDVPGHVRFLRNMLAGVGGIDACLLVVDSREGWKPQTEEHFEILRLLGVPCGVIAFTKCDLVTATEVADEYIFVPAAFTTTWTFGGGGDVTGVSTGVVAGSVTGVVGVADGVTGASFTGLEAGAVTGAGAVLITFSRYHAAAKPSCPSAVRTRTHCPFTPIFDSALASVNVSSTPAGIFTTKFAILDVSVLERMLSPAVTSAETRARGPLPKAVPVVG